MLGNGIEELVAATVDAALSPLKDTLAEQGVSNILVEQQLAMVLAMLAELSAIVESLVEHAQYDEDTARSFEKAVTEKRRHILGILNHDDMEAGDTATDGTVEDVVLADEPPQG